MNVATDSPTIRRPLRIAAWLSFFAEVAILGTGGAVRLTDSGLGCEWPLCTPDSLYPTPELGIHAFIEFGNRMMSGVVGILALLVLILVWRLRRERRDLFVLSIIVVAGVVAQAIVGGVTVRTGLNAWVVGFHYLASLVLVCVTAAFLARAYSPAGARERAVPGWFSGITHLTTLVLAITVVVGVMTTSAGPHSGDPDVIRQGFDATLLSHIHSWPAYTLFALTVVLVIAGWRLRLPTLRWSLALLAIELVQIGVGLYQARNGLPPLAVGVHMVLAGLLSATMTVLVLRLKRPVAADVPAEASVAA